MIRVLVLLYAVIMWQVLSAQAGPIRFLPHKFCGRPDFPDAYYEGPVLVAPHDTALKLTCRPGFKSGFPTTTCREGQWTEPTPPCKSIECPRLPDPPHGKVLQENRSYLATLEVQCEHDYMYSEPSFAIRRCLANATWSWGNGSCQAETCPELTRIDNGVLSGTTGNFKDVVTLVCNSGYILDGASSIYCMAGGTWSATMGICKGQGNFSEWGLVAFLIGTTCGLLVAVAAFILKRTKSTRRAMTRPNVYETNIPLLPKDSELYLHLNVTHSFGCEYGDESSSQYAVVKSLIEQKVLAAMKNNQVSKIDVLRLHKPDKIFLCIISQEPIDQEDVCAALQQVNIPCTVGRNSYKVVPKSLIFDDKVTNHIKLQILRGKHIRDHKMDYEIDLDSQYEELGIIRRNGTSHFHKDGGEDISDVDIIEDGAKKGVVLILGRAGVGKSTLMQRLARKWANGVWATHIKAIFFLNLRYLMSDKKEMTFASLVCMRPTYANMNNILDIDDEWLVENQEAIIIMLDGLDEIGKIKRLWKKYGNFNSDDTPLDWCFRLLKREHLPKSTLLVSSRSSEDVCSLLGPTDTVEVMGLSSTRITSFIKKNVEEKHRKKVNQSLKGNPTLMSISSVTFYCAALCSLLQKDDMLAEELNTYTKITAYLLEMYICRSLKDGHTWEDVYDEMRASLRSMSQLAYNGLTESRSETNFKECYTEENLREAGINDKNMVKLQDAGLLVRTEIPDMEDPHKYSIHIQSVHSSIQEYMTMANLLTQDRDERKRTLDSISSTSSQFNMALLYLVGLAFNEEENAVSRTARALGNLSQRDPEATKEIKEALTDAAVSVPDPLLAIQMVHESQSTIVASRVGEQRFRDGVTLKNIKMTLFEVKGLTFLLRNCTSVARIELRHVGLDLSSIKEMSILLGESKSIKETSLLDSTLDGEAIREILEAIKKNKHLQKLELSFGRNIGDDSMQNVADALSINTHLKDLWLVGGNLRTGGAHALLKALQTRIQEVRIRMHNHTCDESTEKELGPFIQRGILIFEEECEAQERPMRKDTPNVLDRLLAADSQYD